MMISLLFFISFFSHVARLQFMAIRELMDELEEEMDDISKEQVSDCYIIHVIAFDDVRAFTLLENVDRHRQKLHEHRQPIDEGEA
jgi:hypothetical protein